MQNFYVITPVYNDWKSVNKLIYRIDAIAKKLKGKLTMVLVNDCSTLKQKLKLDKIHNINDIKIINLTKNLGSQKAIYIGLRYIQKKLKESIITIIDSDGEDDPKKINFFIKEVVKKKEFICVANRGKRKEFFLLRILNQLRILINFVLTGYFINFGNFTCFHSKLLKKNLNKNLWIAYSAGVQKNFDKIKYINVDKADRYFGKSKVGFTFLIKHTLNILTVFKKEIFIRSSIIICLLLYFVSNHFFLVLYFILNIFLFINYYYLINEKNPLKKIKNIKNIKL